ncbi:flagellar export protein FliJ [Sedimentibacter sp. MB31-C6]|uniref:flagellar export protein FliJ n=1 Tax=Sedimentibacter sp. MB31-C6 TaxID=3109366 RepID=UPI002DDD8D57|nr:flagellar export protein FliJ [Sedimentibacter sp. MB36-C1]WSI04992.1 flagellar export protein FliJ [Sedimentibacter sp. MB36-C1]
MKKFNFSLQKVLEIKEQILESLRMEMSNFNHEKRQIELDIRNLNMKYATANTELNEKSSKSITVGEMLYYKMYMENIFKNIEDKQKEKEAIDKKIEAKRREIVDVNKEISSLEKLKEKELDKYKYELDKKEEIYIEEFVSNNKILKQYV